MGGVRNPLLEPEDEDESSSSSSVVRRLFVELPQIQLVLFAVVPIVEKGGEDAREGEPPTEKSTEGVGRLGTGTATGTAGAA